MVAIIQDVTVTQTARLLTATGVASNPQGNEIAYHKVTFSNPNPVNLTQATFSLNLGTNLIVYSTGASTTCGAGTFSFVGNTVTFSGGTIPPKIAAVNGTCDVNIQVQPERSITLPSARIRPTISFPIGNLTTLE